MSNLPPLHMTRSEIAAFVGDDPRAIKTLENLVRYINTVIAPQIQGLQISEFADYSRSGDEERNLAAKADLNSLQADSKAQQALEIALLAMSKTELEDNKAQEALDIASRDSRIVKSNRVMAWLSTQ